MDSDLIIPPPTFDNTLLTLVDWALSLQIPHTPKLVLLIIVRHVDWQTGRRCYLGIPRLITLTGLSNKSLTKHLNWLKAAGIINRRRRVGGSAETWLVATEESTHSNPVKSSHSATEESTHSNEELSTLTDEELSSVTSNPPSSQDIQSLSPISALSGREREIGYNNGVTNESVLVPVAPKRPEPLPICPGCGVRKVITPSGVCSHCFARQRHLQINMEVNNDHTG